MALAKLTIDVEAKLANIEKDMAKVGNLAEAQAGRMEKAFSAAGVAFGAIGGVGIVAGLVNQFRLATDSLDALNDAADATGSSIENLSALEDIAERTGTSFDTAVSAVVKFNSVLSQAGDGDSGAAKALRAIGLSAEELKKQDPAEALRLTAVALSGFADDGDKARLVQELVGKSVREVAPLLKDLAESGKLNATVTSAQAAEAERFNRQMSELAKNATDVSRSIASELLPVLNELFRTIKGQDPDAGLFGIGGEAYKQRIELEKLRLTAKSTAEALSDAQGMSGAQRILWYGTSDLAELKTRADAAAAAVDKAKAAYYRMSDAAGGGRGVINPDVVKPNVGDISLKTPTPKKPAAEDQTYQRYLDNLQKQLEKTQELSAAEQVLADIQAKRLGPGLTPGQAGAALDLAEQVDQAKRADAAYKALIADWDAIEKASAAATERANRYFEAALTPAEKLQSTLEDINALYNQGAFGTVGSTDAMEKMGRAIAAAKSDSDKLTEGAKEMADAFKDAVLGGKDLGKALEAIAMKRFIFEPLSKAIDGLFSALSGAGGGAGGDVFARLAGSIGFSLFGSSATGAALGPQVSLGSGMEGLSYSDIINGSHANGLDYVPFDGYVAELHKGERVLTAAEASRNTGSAVTVNVVNNTGAQVQTRESNSGGERRIEVVVGEVVAGEVRRTGSAMNTAQRQAFGLNPALTRR